MKNCEWFGFWIFMSVMLYLSHYDYINGGESFFFKDKTQIEKDKREIQKIETQLKLKKLKEMQKENK